MDRALTIICIHLSSNSGKGVLKYTNQGDNLS